MCSQPAHRLDIELPRPFSQSGQYHVLDHPRTLWRHGGLLSLMFRRTTLPAIRKDTLANTHDLTTHALGEAVPANDGDEHHTPKPERPVGNQNGQGKQPLALRSGILDVRSTCVRLRKVQIIHTARSLRFVMKNLLKK